MCAIVDASVASQVFSPDRPEAGARFFEWIDSGTGRLVVGGKLLEELHKTPAHRWIPQAILSGMVTIIDEKKVNTRTIELQNQDSCKSNDPHVVALAQISGARLLYTNDPGLQEDFNNKTLIDSPRGKIYSTLKYPHFRKSHKQVLKNRNLCSSGS